MCWLYARWHWLVQRWILAALLLIAATFCTSLVGLARDEPGNTWSTDFYKTLKLFAIDGDEENLTGWREAARWLGAVVWAFAIVTVLVGLFRERVQTWYVVFCTGLRFGRGHVIVAGLGDPSENRDKLVLRLRERGRDVVVLEPDPSHPGLTACRTAGAICLAGSPEEPTQLDRARLRDASAVLVLGADSGRNVRLLGSVVELLDRSNSPRVETTPDDDPLAPSAADRVGGIVQVDEPGALQILRQHDVSTGVAGRLRPRLFNVYEIVARAMLREALVGPEIARMKRVLLVGTGAAGHLGEALVVRAGKDRWIDCRDPESFVPLEIHVLDLDAERWLTHILGRHSFLSDVCRLSTPPEALSASRLGFRAGRIRALVDEYDFDAAFVCLENEAHGLVQTAQLREVLDEAVPIVVCVREESSGFGELFAGDRAGGIGRNVRVVGLQDRIHDVVCSMDPTVEIMAQVLHQDYLFASARQRAAEHAPDRPADADRDASLQKWTQLDERLRESNRSLARRMREHRVIAGADSRRERRFRMEFAPEELFHPSAMMPLTEDECEGIARREHELWAEELRGMGWTHGTEKSLEHQTNPRLVAWEDLDENGRELARNIVRRLPHVYAKADYRLVEID